MLPLLDSWDSKGVAFLVKQATPPIGLVIETAASSIIRLFPDSVVVEFKYTFEIDPWRPPEPLLQRPYSELLEEIARTMREVVEALADRAPLHINRVGIVATTQMSPTSAPPGVQRMLTHYEGAWAGVTRSIDTNILVSTEPNGNGNDQCHHRLQLDRTKQPQPANNLELSLDWQRFWPDEKTFTAAAAQTCITSGVRDALSYFQRVGEGEF
jgi:hypothetical protein